jgi:hypothetical protein
VEEVLKRQNIVAPRNLSTKDMYGYYTQKNPTSKIPYWMFKEVIARFNKRAADAIIFGQVLNIGNRLGYILIKKIRRNYRKPVVNWGQSKTVKNDLIKAGITPKDENNPQGTEWMVFYTDPWYLRWAWSKKRICRVKNQTVYKFMPTSNKSKIAGDNSLDKLGNKGKLTLANKINPTLHYMYEDKS